LEKFSKLTVSEVEQVDIVELLLRRQAELNNLLEITQAINKNIPETVLIEMLELIIKNSLKVEKFMLLLKQDGHFECVSNFGGSSYTEQDFEAIIKQVENYWQSVELSGHEDPLLNKYDYFIPVHHNNSPQAYVFLGELELEQKTLLKTKISYIQTLINVIIVAFENKKLFKERIQKERLQRELELAGEVQNMLIPNLPKSEGLDIDAIYRPHQNVGGDFFDLIALNEQEFVWCIADVSGKGISAALIMANFQASLRALVSTGICLKALVQKLNTLVFRNTEGERFLTLFLGKFNKETREITYINAGHNAPLLVQNNKVEALEKGTIVIGAIEELPFVQEGNLQIEKGAILFNYTDGIVEHDGDEDKAISEEQLKEFLYKYQDLELAELHKKLIVCIDQRRCQEAATDDITMLSFRFK